MENRSPILTAPYVDKANHFLDGMRLLAEDIATYRTGIALLAVHSAISLNDAILVGVTGDHSRSDDHAAAARELERVCSELRIEETQGLRHLAALLSRKSDIAYGGKRIDDREVKFVMDRAERFANWAYNRFREVLGGRRS